MSLLTKSLLLAGVSTAALGFHAAIAASSFSDPLTSLDNTHFTLADTATAGRMLTFTTSGASFSTGGDNGRNYLRTVDSNYNGADFSASVRLSTADGTEFIGFGPGNLGNSSEPGGSGASNPSIYLRLRTGGSEQILTNGPFGSTLGTFTTNVGANQNVTLLLSYASATSTLTFGLDTNNDGTSEENLSALLSQGQGGTFNATNSRIFFGGSGNTTAPTFSNFAVTVPEPTTWAVMIGGLVVLFGLQRRRPLAR